MVSRVPALPVRGGIAFNACCSHSSEWVSWFNNQRPMGPLGYIHPAEAEANYYRQFNRRAAMAA